MWEKTGIKWVQGDSESEEAENRKSVGDIRYRRENWESAPNTCVKYLHSMHCPCMWLKFKSYWLRLVIMRRLKTQVALDKLLCWLMTEDDTSLSCTVTGSPLVSTGICKAADVQRCYKTPNSCLTISIRKRPILPSPTRFALILQIKWEPKCFSGSADLTEAFPACFYPPSTPPALARGSAEVQRKKWFDPGGPMFRPLTQPPSTKWAEPMQRGKKSQNRINAAKGQNPSLAQISSVAPAGA